MRRAPKEIAEGREAWTLTRLRYAASVNPSKSEVSDWSDDMAVTFVPMEAVGEDGSMEISATRELGEVRTGYTYFRSGDVVVAKITPCFENGKGALTPALPSGVAFGTTELIVIRARDGEADGAFLHWLTRTEAFRAFGEAAMYGAGGQKRVPEDFVRDFPVRLPPLEEQRAIAAFLDRETARIDSAVAAQERLIALLAEKRAATISHAVTKSLDPNAPMKDSGIEWLGQIPAHWELRRLARLVDPKRKITYGIVQPGELAPDGRFMVRGQDYSKGWADSDSVFRVSAKIEEPYKRARLRAGDVVFTIVGAGTGNVAVVPEQFNGANITQTTARISPDRSAVEPLYLAMALSSAQVAIQTTMYQKGAAQPGLNLEHLKEFRIPCPPMEEQRRLVRRVASDLEQLSSLSSRAGNAITLLKERRAALISAAVTGRIDVRRQVSEAQEAA